MSSKRHSPWRVACDRLERARATDWSDPAQAEQAWDRLSAVETRLLVPARDADDLKDKLHYLLQVSDPPQSRSAPNAARSLKVRLLHSAVKDAIRFAEASELDQRCDALRRHAATLAPTAELAAQVSALRRELNEARAERDAAYSALARRNGWSVVEPGPVALRRPNRGGEDGIHV